MLAPFRWETRVYCSETKLGLEARLINNMIHFLEFLNVARQAYICEVY